MKERIVLRELLAHFSAGPLFSPFESGPFYESFR